MIRSYEVPASGPSQTRRTHQHAVERVIRAMVQRPAEPLSLGAMAKIAILSPFHFNRIFRSVTGLPPQKFQAALRMEQAKRLLITTTMSVTEVCFEVGYSSLGSFTSHFTSHVGLPPRHLRRLADDQGAPALPRPPAPPQAESSVRPRSLVGHIAVPTGCAGPIFIGLFTTPLPQGKPTACAVLRAPGDFQIDQVPDGSYCVFAMAVEQAADSRDYLLPDESACLVGAGGMITISHGTADRTCVIDLRRATITDPPILLAIPALFPGHVDECPLQERAVGA